MIHEINIPKLALCYTEVQNHKAVAPLRRAERAAFRVPMIDVRRRLEDEIKELDYELKVQLPKEIQRAREFGDLRENAEYNAAKERQTYIEARLAQLRRRVAALSLISPERIPQGKVSLGAVVTLRVPDNDDEIVYEIVTPEEVDPANGRISVSSPIGKCLLGREEGDTVVVKVPAGTKEYEIVKLVTIHDQVDG
jgi:transcription elongation factor GreA